jgi:Tfp pilus assembly protein PilN
MATTMTPETAAGAQHPTGETLRFVSIRADLLPDEVISARRTDVVRQRVLVGLAVLVLLLVGAYGASWWQTSGARSDLSDLQHRGVGLQTQQKEFGALVSTQSQVLAIQSQLQSLMAGDVPWKAMLTTLRETAPQGVELTQLSGSVTAGAAAAGAAQDPNGYEALNSTGLVQIGTLAVAGTAPDKRSVAAYADKLAKVKGLAAPFITSVTVTDRTVTFAMTVLITSDALGGRYPAAAPTTPGGK